VCCDGDAADETKYLGLFYKVKMGEFNIYVTLNLHSSTFFFPLSPFSPVRMSLPNIPNIGHFVSLHTGMLMSP
jgi:hypothetical protein